MPRVAEKQLLDVPLGLIEKLDYEGVTSEAEKIGLPAVWLLPVPQGNRLKRCEKM